MGSEEVKDGIGDMNKSFGFETAKETKEDETIEKEVVEDEPKEDEEIEGEVKGGTQEKEAGEEGIPFEGIKEEIEPKKEVSEEDEKDKTIAELRKKLDEKEVKEEPEPEPTGEPITFESQDFLAEDEDLEDLVRDPKKLNEVFNSIYQRAVTDTRKVLGEGVLRSIPDIVRVSVDMMDKLKEMNNKFFTDNADLKPFRKVVAAVFEEVATDNPGKDMMDLLPMVATESRNRLELHKQAIKPDDEKSPRLHSRKKRVTIPESKPNTNLLLNEIEEMNKTIGGI